jgi:hypothetical protein
LDSINLLSALCNEVKDMKSKPISLYLSVLVLGVFLVLFMTGCSGITTLPTQNPSATSTTSTPAHTTPTTNLQTYTCDLFQVSYPDPWQVMIGRSNQVELGGLSKSTFDIIAQSDTSKTAEEALAHILLTMNDEYTHFQPVDVQPAATIGGQNWRQVTWTGTNKSSDLDFKGRETVINYNGHQYIMSYSALASDFDQNDKQYFQIIQQSFAFKPAA